jgi:hypothetical protein
MLEPGTVECLAQERIQPGSWITLVSGVRSRDLLF